MARKTDSILFTEMSDSSDEFQKPKPKHKSQMFRQTYDNILGSQKTRDSEEQLEAQKQKYETQLKDQKQKYEEKLKNQSNEFKKLESKTKELETKLETKTKELESKLKIKTKELEEKQIEIKKLQEENKKFNQNEIKIINENTLNNIEKIEEIGYGSGGKVFKVIFKKVYALKEMNIENADMDTLKKFINEYELLILFKHPNIINAYGIFLSNDKVPPFILLEYCPTNLEKEIKNKSFSNEEIVKIIYQIAEAMKYIHFHKVIHRDLKPTNILISDDGSVKICDFGISKLMTVEEQTMTSGIGSQKFMAPEIINEEEHYDEKVDVYSFGVVIFYILSQGQIPKIKVGDILKGKKAEIPSTFTQFAKDLIYDCWNFESKDRPSFKMIVDRLNENHYKLIDLTETETKNIEIFVEQHKKKIPHYDE